jgi:hypothetical protein
MHDECRHVVEYVGVVDEDQQLGAVCLCRQAGDYLLSQSQGRGVGRVGPAGEGPQCHGPPGGRARDPADRPARLNGSVGDGASEARLAHASRAGDDHAALGLLGESLADDAELLRAASQRPQVHHGDDLRSCWGFAEGRIQFPSSQVEQGCEPFRFYVQIATDHVVGHAGVMQA